MYRSGKVAGELGAVGKKSFKKETSLDRDYFVLVLREIRSGSISVKIDVVPEAQLGGKAHLEQVFDPWSYGYRGG